MKKGVLLILSVALFLLAVGGGFAVLYFSPRGVLRPDSPESVMQSCMDTMDAELWRDTYCRLCAPEVTDFEDAQTVAGHLFDSMPAADFTFRESAAEDNAVEYIISRGETDFLRMRTVFADGHWQPPEPLASTALRPAPRTLYITVPEGSTVTVNGLDIGNDYLENENVPYNDISELEQRFLSVPHRVRYRIDGLFENAFVDAQRAGGLVLLSGGMTDWEYTLPEGGSHSFRVTAPEAATVTVNGAELSEAETAASTVMPVSVNIPDTLFDLIPAFRIYTAGGLYSVPEISASLPDGTALVSSENGSGDVSFVLPGVGSFAEECDARVAEFLTCLLHYGAGHTWEYIPYAYLAEGSELNDYCSRARSSLHWVTGVTLNIQNITTEEYIPLGEDAFLCRTHVDFETKTQFQTLEFAQDYQMIWLREGTVWKVYDLAFL